MCKLKMGERLVSVIVPIYMVEKYLHKCIDSLLRQDYPNFEIILIDDGSKDNCPMIADEYASRYSNIITYHKQNGGLGAARNFGVQKANGEWIAFVDSDDYVKCSYISDMVNLLVKFNADMAVTCIKRVKKEKESHKNNTFEDYCCTSGEAIAEAYLYNKIGWEAVGKLLKKEHLLKNPFPVGYYEDCACMYRIMNECNKIAIGSYVKNYHYISRTGSILQTRLKPEHMRIFDISEEFSRFYMSKFPYNKNKLALLYRKIIIQLLTCQKMEYSQFTEIYRRYVHFFRENFVVVISEKKLKFADKVYYTMLCTNPLLFKIFVNLVNLKNKI